MSSEVWLRIATLMFGIVLRYFDERKADDPRGCLDVYAVIATMGRQTRARVEADPGSLSHSTGWLSPDERLTRFLPVTGFSR
jgi:hypothetical protein